MTILIKQGVCGELKPIAQKGLGRVARLYAASGEDLIITSIREGNHSFGSFHYIGLAFDFRQAVKAGVEDIRAALGPDWDVIVHSTHIHVEYDPKGGY